jgi:ABC-2 type transport system permease protein
VRAYLALLGAGFQRQNTYRLALVAGLTTNAFFGVVRTAIFFALYRERDQVAGLDVADALTYVWVLEGLFAVVWAPWFWELAEAIRSGEFIAELLRPGDPYLRLAAFDLGRTLSVVATRTVPTLTVAALVLPLRLPGTLGGLALLAVSLVLAAVVSFQLRFLFASAAFWTPDYRSMFLFAFPVLWLASGFVVPVDFFPEPAAGAGQLEPVDPAGDGAGAGGHRPVGRPHGRRPARLGGGAVAGRSPGAGRGQPPAGGPWWLSTPASTCGWPPPRCGPPPAGPPTWPPAPWRPR